MDGDVLAAQLAQLGKQLDEATVKLAELDVLATSAGIKAANAKEVHEDRLAEAFIAAEGSVETRKASARLCCMSYGIDAREAAGGWEKAKSQVRNQQTAIRTLSARIEIGRSLLSREKSLMNALGG